MFIFYKLLSPLLIMLAFSTNTFAFSTIVNDTYLFGSGDSMVTAKGILLSNLKKTAADKAGVYIQSDKSYDSSGYKESVKVLSASIVKLNITSEKKGTNANGSFFLTITARAIVDERELKKRIKAIQSDRSKDRLIKSLKKERVVLDSRLAKLKKAFKAKHLSKNQIAQLLQDQTDLAFDIDSHEQAINNVFKRGSLIALANKSSSIYYDELKTFKKQYFRFWRKESNRLKVELSAVNEADRGYEVIIKTLINNKQLLKRFAHIYLPEFKDGHSMLFYGLGPTRIGKKIKRDATRQKMLARAKVISDYNVYLDVGIPGHTKKALFLGFGDSGSTFFNDKAYRVRFNKVEYQKNLQDGSGTYLKDNVFLCDHLCGSPWMKNSNDKTQFFKVKVSNTLASNADRIVASFLLK